MRSFVAWIRKEAIEGARSYRFLVLGVAAAFFAFLDPLMLRLLPAIMKAQVGVDLSTLVPANRVFAFETFVGDLFEIYSLVVCLVLGGIVARERKDRGYVIPRTKGAALGGIVAAKAVVWAMYVATAVFASILVSSIYSGLLFPGTPLAPAHVIRVALYMTLYFVHVVALVILGSTVIRSGVGAALAALAVVYGAPAAASLLRAERYTPSYLALGSSKLAALAQTDFLPAALCAVALIVACLAGANAVLKRVEL